MRTLYSHGVDHTRGIALPAGLIAASLLARLVSLQWLHPLQWDEVEFFRATDWVRHGLVPYRDFWEHHTPLQWFVFAPVAALLHSPGVASIIAMRWAQLPLWIAAFVLLNHWMRGAGIAPFARWASMAFALTTSLFMLPAVEYRVDVLATVLLILGVVVLRRSPFAAGIAFALAGFANLRVGPVAVVAMLAAFWFYGRRAGWAIAGAAATTGIASLYFVATHSLGIAIHELFTENALAGRLQQRIPLMLPHRLLSPFGLQLIGGHFSASAIDPGGIAFLILAVVGAIRSRGEMRFLMIVSAANFLFIAAMKVVFNYHLESVILLAVPLVASQIRDTRIITAALGVAAAMNVSVALFRGKEDDLQYQETIMRAADRLTPPDGRVFDSVGWALHRKPAYRYWLLRDITRLLEAHGELAPYVPSPPPDAVIADHDTRLWLATHPDLRRFVLANYVPVWRDLWIPRDRVRPGTPIDRRPPPGVSIDAEAPPRWHIPHLGYNAPPS